MHIAGHPYSVLAKSEMSLIQRSALRILAEVGMEIQNLGLLKVFADAGLLVDFKAERVRFPTSAVEAYLASADRIDWEHRQPEVTASAGVYQCLFHDPETMTLQPWNEDRLAYYFRLARRLSHVGSASLLGSRIPVPPLVEPLYERYWCFKYGAEEGGSIYLDETCPYLLELYQMRAGMLGVPVKDVFHATVYLVPALRLGRHEAYQVAYFRERGLRVGVGDMYALGATAPVTLAGAVTLNLAEQLALHIFNRVLFGDRRLHLSCSLAPIDMRTMHHTFGRPEMALANVITAQLARAYGASFSGHAGLTDAKFPSVEVGAQKASGATATLLAGGSLWVDAGLLANDEIVSPVQLVLDNEMVSALKTYTHKYEINPESIGLETIFEAGPGGFYLDKRHTARRFRDELWQPAIWTREKLGPWQAGGSKLDVDRAREIALAVKRSAPDEPSLTESQEREILKLIHRAPCNSLNDI